MPRLIEVDAGRDGRARVRYLAVDGDPNGGGW